MKTRPPPLTRPAGKTHAATAEVKPAATGATKVDPVETDLERKGERAVIEAWENEGNPN